MNRDEWREVIQFLEPIDVFASLMAISQDIQSLIEECVVSFDDIAECCCNDRSENCCISFKDDKDDDHIRLLGNVRYFINLYLFKLAIKLNNSDPNENPSVELVLDESQCQLLEFYRLRLLKTQYLRESTTINDGQYILPFITVGNVGIGKTTFNLCVGYGKYGVQQPTNLGVDFHCKTCTLPNGVSIKQQVWDTAGMERFGSKLGLFNRLSRNHNTMFMFCFSMKDENSLEQLDEWFEVARTNIVDRDNTEIILGLYPIRKQNDRVVVNCKDAVKKAWTYERSLFASVDSQNMNNVFVPIWFLVLKYAYFKDLAKLQYQKKEKKPEKPTCLLL